MPQNASPTISYTVSGSVSNTIVTVTGNGTNTNRCLTNCFGLINGIQTSTIDVSDLTKGVPYNLNLLLTEGSCSVSSSASVCCPAIGGSITGNLTPAINTTQPFTVGEIIGNYQLYGMNDGWSISGGNASLASTSSVSTTAQVNVGTLPFTLRYNIASCNEARTIEVNITPQSSGCSLSVSNVSITC